MTNNRNIINNLVSDINANPNRNTILVLGAGVSNESANLPLGKPLANLLIRKLGCNSGLKKTQFENELSILEEKYHFDRDDFKTILFALNKIDSATLVKLTIDSLSIDYGSINSSIYKIIWQLFYNNSVDHIINFNFDKILDNELLTNKNYFDYSQINSDKDILHLKNNNKIKKFYVKPHGTIDQPNTLRFQRKDYYKLENKTNDFLYKIFSEKPVNLILMGFRLKFHDISTLIGYWLKPSSMIYIFDKEEDVLGKELSDSFYYGDFIQITNQFTLEDSLKYLVKTSFEINSIPPKGQAHLQFAQANAKT